MPYRIRVDRDLCIGAATCEAIAPKSFKLDEENKAILIKKDGSTETTGWVSYADLPDDAAALLEAAKGCPVNAIIIEDDNGKQIWP